MPPMASTICLQESCFSRLTSRIFSDEFFTRHAHSLLTVSLLAPRRRRTISIFADEADQLALDVDPVGSENPGLVGGIGGFQRDRGAALAQALQRRFLVVDQRDDDVAGFGGVLLA